MQYRLKMLPGHYREMQACLLKNTAVEQGCFLLCSTAGAKNETLLLVREVITLASDELAIQKKDLLSVKPEAMLRVARLAQQQQASICMVHTHPMVNGPVNFSTADDLGNVRTFRFFNRLLPEALNSCLVWNGNMRHASGRIYQTATTWDAIARIEVVGNPSLINDVAIKQDDNDSQPQETYSRQALILGQYGQNMLHRLRIGVIGCGGIGSCATVMLAHSGVGEIRPVDYDCVEESNRPRIPGAQPEDVLSKTPKVDVIKRYLERVSPDCRVITYKTVTEDPYIRSGLIGLDAIICTTDNTRSRAYINQLCQQYYIPLLDLGTEFVSNDQGELVNEIGKANLILPGTACLLCSNHIDPDRLRAETLPKNEREQLIEEGYIRGFDVHQPSMMMFNMEVAARGIQLLLGQLAGLMAVDMLSYERFSFLGLNRRQHHKHVRKLQQQTCLFCAPGSHHIGAGDSLPPLINSIASERRGG